MVEKQDRSSALKKPAFCGSRVPGEGAWALNKYQENTREVECYLIEFWLIGIYNIRLLRTGSREQLYWASSATCA